MLCTPIHPLPDRGALGPRPAEALAAYEASLGRRLSMTELADLRAAAHAASPVGPFGGKR